jgi:hypothetical protein
VSLPQEKIKREEMIIKSIIKNYNMKNNNIEIKTRTNYNIRNDDNVVISPLFSEIVILA